MIDVNREYSRSRTSHADVFGVYKLRPEERVALGLQEPEPLRGTIHIVIPEHYGAKGLMWTSRFVTEAQLESYKAQYPDMQIIGEGGERQWQI